MQATNDPRLSLYDFIVKNYTKYDFKLTKERDTIFPANYTYNDFLRDQHNSVMSLDDNTLKFALQLMGLINSGAFDLIDKESMVTFPSDGFFFHGTKFMMTNSA